MRRTVAALAGLMLATPAGAITLDGTSMTLRYNFDTLPSTADTLAIGAGAEATCPGPFNLCDYLTAATQTIDAGGLAIRWEYSGGLPVGFNIVSPNEFVFDDLAPGGAIVGVSLATNLANLDASDISFTATSVTLNMAGASGGNGAFFELSLEVVPEPASLALFGLGLAALVPLRRRAA